jgi:hypothetical protein
MLSGCAEGHDEALIGVWRWYEYGETTYEFMADGTGVRGLAGSPDTFRWSTNGAQLDIRRDVRDGYLRNERWLFQIEDDILNLTNLRDFDQRWSYIFDSGENYAALVGTWRWEDYGDYAFILNADGTGVRGFTDETETFTWTTTGTRLVISRDAQDSLRRSERWTFDVDGDVLTIDNQQFDDLTWRYFSDSLAQDENLVGTWVFDASDAFSYVFEADGTGTRGTADESENFTWTTTNDRLLIHAPELVFFYQHWERWTYTIYSNTLTLENQILPDRIFTYTRQ